MKRYTETSQSLNATRQNSTGATRQNSTGDKVRNGISCVQREVTDPDRKGEIRVENATFRSKKVVMSAKQDLSSSDRKEVAGEEHHQTAKIATYMILLCFVSFLLLSLLGCATQKAYTEPHEFNNYPPQKVIHIT